MHHPRGLACLAALLAACTIELEPSADARIACASNDVCPEGWSCAEVLGVCVQPGRDQSAPQLAGIAVVTPTLARAGTEVTISFATTEPLGLAPVVSLQLAQGVLRDVEVFAAADTSFVATYVAEGDEPVDAPLQAALVDTYGNQATVSVTTLRFDFTPPSLSEARFTAPASRGSVRSSEVVQFAVTVTVDAAAVRAELHDELGGVLAILPLLESGSTAAGQLDLATLDLGGATELSMSFIAEDAVGNESAPLSTSALIVDDSPPVAGFVGTPPSGVTSATDYALAFSAPGAVSFRCRLNGEPLGTCVSPLVLADLPVGANELELYATDEAGNEQATPTVASWTIERRWRQVAAGGEHTCALATDHSIWCWGGNRHGELGVGTSGPQSSLSLPWAIFNGGYWQSVAAGTQHTCAIARDGGLWCWGGDDQGQLGVGAFPYAEARKEIPTRVGTATDWLMVAVNGSRTCGIRGAAGQGSLWCWGETELSAPQRLAVNVPKQVGVETDWTFVTVGWDHACGVRDDGGTNTAWCWGEPSSGQLGVGPPMTYIWASVAPVQVSGVTQDDWKALSAGRAHTCGVKNDGSLWCWGANELAQAGGTPIFSYDEPHQVGSATDWLEVSCGADFTCARAPGGVQCFGSNRDGVLDAVDVGAVVADPAPWGGTSTGVAQSSSGGYHACIVNDAEELHCQGRGAAGQIGNATLQPDRVFISRVGTAADWLRVASGQRHTCGIRLVSGSRGTLWCWGNGDDGQLGLGDTYSHATPQQVGGDSDWFALEVGSRHSCAVRDTGTLGDARGTLYCWGANESGQAEVDPAVATRVLSPSQVGTDTRWTDKLALGERHSCAVLADGTAALHCWGDNQYLQLGFTGVASTATHTATGLAGLNLVTGVPTLSAGDYHTCAIDAGTFLSCWGHNLSSQVGLPPSSAELPYSLGKFWGTVAAGGEHTCGTSSLSQGPTGYPGYCWGSGRAGQLQITPDVLVSADPVIIEMDDTQPAGFEQLSGGGAFTCGSQTALLGDTLTCWGDSSEGQIQLANARLCRWSSHDAGGRHACAISGTRQLWCWGSNERGQLGLASLWVPLAEVVAPQVMTEGAPLIVPAADEDCRSDAF